MSEHADTDKSRAVPRHVAVIMDGNGRLGNLVAGCHGSWATVKGAKIVRPIVEAAADAGVEYLTMFAFSAENWTRPEDEVAELMGLLRLYLRSQIADLHKNGVRLRVIGDRTRLSNEINNLVDSAENTDPGQHAHHAADGAELWQPPGNRPRGAQHRGRCQIRHNRSGTDR